MFLTLLNRFHVPSRASSFKACAPPIRTHLSHLRAALVLGSFYFPPTSNPHS